MNALEIKNLRKTFPGFTLEGLNLALPAGCILGLIGENGAGKSTTIKLILDMLHKDSGTVTILGRDNQDNLPLTKEDIGVVMDEQGIPAILNTAQVGKIMAGIFRNWDPACYRDYLERLSLPENKPFKDFSRGMKMKLGIAIALSHHPRLLILDEATSGLDPVARDEVVELLMDFTREEDHAILISSHIVSDLEKLCDYIAFLHKGRLMLLEEKDVLLYKYAIVQGSPSDLACVPGSAILHKKQSPYGVQAVILREAVPAGLAAIPVSIEDLFVYMVKEAK